MTQLPVTIPQFNDPLDFLPVCLARRTPVKDSQWMTWLPYDGARLWVLSWVFLISLLYAFNAVVSIISPHDEEILYKSLDSVVSSLTAF
jgi:hypothetical protein